VALLDDLEARRCADSLHIPVLGTVGVVLLAKRGGVIPSARPVLEKLVAVGMYLSGRTLSEALRRVEE
jgi:predicted nucleic acid-binding protein